MDVRARPAASTEVFGAVSDEIEPVPVDLRSCCLPADQRSLPCSSGTRQQGHRPQEVVRAKTGETGVRVEQDQTVDPSGVPHREGEGNHRPVRMSHDGHGFEPECAQHIAQPPHQVLDRAQSLADDAATGIAEEVDRVHAVLVGELARADEPRRRRRPAAVTAKSSVVPRLISSPSTHYLDDRETRLAREPRRG